jgi:hypothetical protein
VAAGRGRPPLRPLIVPVQEHCMPVGDDGHVLLLPLPCDAAADDGGVRRWMGASGGAVADAKLLQLGRR